MNFEQGGRNSYPDFRLVQFTEGYELKGLAYPGRDATFDSNSQVPTGLHNGRSIYYVFGRYPKHPDGDTYPVLDLVIAHGDFLNASHEYVHKNKSVKGFGTYGDLMIRDRKMYVVPTPFRIADGSGASAHADSPGRAHAPGDDLIDVGELVRREADHLVVAYTFDLRTNELGVERVPNPHAGREHRFHAWRIGQAGTPVVMAEEQRSDDAGAATHRGQTVSRSNLSRHWRSARAGVKRYTGPFTTSTNGGRNVWALSSEG